MRLTVTVGCVKRAEQKRDAVRAARSAPSAGLITVAAAVGLQHDAVERLLVSTPNMASRCVSMARQSFASAVRGRRAVGTETDSEVLRLVLSRRCPPPLMRVAASRRDIHPTVAAAAETAAGTAAWLRREPPHRGATRQAMLGAFGEPDSRIRQIVAADTACPPILLQHLAAPEEWSEIKAAAAGNPAAGAALTAQLAAEPDTAARYAAAANPALPARLMRSLTSDDLIGVRRGVALNAGCGTDLLAMLAQDRRIEVRAAAAANPNTINGAAGPVVPAALRRTVLRFAVCG